MPPPRSLKVTGTSALEATFPELLNLATKASFIAPFPVLGSTLKGGLFVPLLDVMISVPFPPSNKIISSVKTPLSLKKPSTEINL